jgi:hypothetical protein
LLSDLPDKLHDLLGASIPYGWEADARRQDMIGPKPGIDMLQPYEARNQKAGAD